MMMAGPAMLSHTKMNGMATKTAMVESQTARITNPKRGNTLKAKSERRVSNRPPIAPPR